MKAKWISAHLLGVLLLVPGLCPVFAGDSIYGKVTEVRSADLLIFDYGGGQYELRLVGIDMPEGPLAEQAKQLVADLVLGKNVRMRFDHRAPNGEMLSRVLTDDPVIGIKDVGVELVRAGLARREPQFDYKYGELSAAEREARNAQRGLWAPPVIP